MTTTVTTALPPHMAVRRTVTEALASMGETSEGVANKLRSAGIKGVRKSDTCCPIARALNQLPGVHTVEVIDDHANVFISGQASYVVVDLPDPVREFVWLFDEQFGPYMDLVEKLAVAS